MHDTLKRPKGDKIQANHTFAKARKGQINFCNSFYCLINIRATTVRIILLSNKELKVHVRQKEGDENLANQQERASLIFLLFDVFRYARLNSCLTPLPVDGMGKLQSWPKPWPQRLTSKPPSLPTDSDAKDKFFKDSKRWSELVMMMNFNN